MLIFKIPSLRTEMDKRCVTGVESWSKNSTNGNTKVAWHSEQSIRDIKKLQIDHPLQVTLRHVESGGTAYKMREEKWKQLEEQIKSNNESTIRNPCTHRNNETANKSQHFPRFLTDSKLDPALKRSMLRWLIYKFPVRCQPTTEEKTVMEMIKDTDRLTEEQYRYMVETIRVVFNAEQERWGMWKLRRSYIQDLRSNYRT